MKKISVMIQIALINLMTLPAAGFAQEATGSQSLTDKIKERLQETAEQGLETIKTALTEEVSAPKPKAYVGAITAMTDNTINLQFKNETLLVNFDANTEIVQARGRVPLDPEDLKTEEFLLAFGFVVGDSVNLRAVEIQRIAKPESPTPRQLVSGPISEIDGNRLTVSGKTITVGGRTDFAISGEPTGELEDLALNDYLFAIVTLDEDGDIDTVSSVLIKPGKNNPLVETPTNQGATESAETATASAN